MWIEGAFARNVSPATADHQRDLAFIVELLRHARALDRLLVPDQRGGRAAEQARILRGRGGVFVFIVALGVVDADAPDFLRRWNGRQQGHGGEWVMRSSVARSLACRVERAGRNQIAQRCMLGQTGTQVDDAAIHDRAVALAVSHPIARQPHHRPPRVKAQPTPLRVRPEGRRIEPSTSYLSRACTIASTAAARLRPPSRASVLSKGQPNPRRADDGAPAMQRQCCTSMTSPTASRGARSSTRPRSAFGRAQGRLRHATAQANHPLADRRRVAP